MMLKLSPGQCAAAAASSEFGSDVIAAASFVAVILTQSWCPQWLMMKTWLEGPDPFEVPASTAVFFLEYDKEPCFEALMAWKEEILGNRQIPYVRYYRDGIFVSQSNYVPKDFFIAKLSG